MKRLEVELGVETLQAVLKYLYPLLVEPENSFTKHCISDAFKRSYVPKMFPLRLFKVKYILEVGTRAFYKSVWK